MSTEYYIPGNFAGYNAGSAQFTPGNLIPGGGNTQNYNPPTPGNTYNPPTISGYNAPTGTNNPIYSPGVCGSYTGNFAASYNPGSVTSYTGNFVATYNALGTENYTPGNISGYTGNFAATYTPAGTESYNSGTASYNPGFAATYNAPIISSYNEAVISSYNAAVITSYNPPTIVGYNPPSGGGGGGGGCCFSGDTLITMADNSTKPINMIEVGDQILSYNFDTEQLETNEVAEIITRVNRVMFEYILENGITLKASDDHPLFVVGKGFSSMNPELTKQGYKSLPDVGMIAAGDSLVNKNGNAIRINKIVPIDYPHIVYTLNNRYKSSPTFYANGVLTY